ncbi:MAG: lamin tail domain-containing protein [Patescibacteria group bacterium]
MNRFVALSIAIVLLSTSIVHANIRMTEIAWMGTSESSFCEWFELYNDGTDSVNLSGWKLYEDGGSQVVFTMTTPITSQGYLLIERTTPSCPDPVPSVSDEAGSFSGSGLSNTGENLVLKDEEGATIQTLDYSSGWPAGDATTKETMQWDGSGWVTAVATPKASTQGGGGGGSSPSELQSGTAWVTPKQKPHIELSVPRTIYATVASEYSQKVFLEYGEAYNGVFLWNMGDGTVYRNNTPKEVIHTYKYPAVYTITFAYYQTPYDNKPLLFESQEHTVILPTVSLRTISGKGFEFTNSGSVPIDISKWMIILSDTTVQLPPFTIIAPKKTVIMPFSVFSIGEWYTKGTLQTPQWVTVGNNAVVENRIVASSPNNISPIIPQPTSLVSSEGSIATANAIGAISESKENKPTKSQTKSIVFALVLFVVIGLFVALERFIGLQVKE